MRLNMTKTRSYMISMKSWSRYCITLVILVSTITLWFMSLYNPIKSSIELDQNSIINITSKLQSTPTDAQQNAMLQQQTQELKTQINEYSAQNAQPLSLTECIHSARTTNVCIDNCSIEKNPREGNNYSNMISIQGHASLQQIHNFLAQLAQEKRSISFKSLTLALLQESIFSFSLHMQN